MTRARDVTPDVLVYANSFLGHMRYAATDMDVRGCFE
jgi:hypothetical protein